MNRYTLALVGVPRRAGLMEPFGLSPDTLPAMGITEAGTERHFTYRGDVTVGVQGTEEVLPVLNAEAVASFVKAFLAGELKDA